MFYTDIKTNTIDKWVVMKILQSKGIISFDEDNYNDMRLMILNISGIDVIKVIFQESNNIGFGVSELISIEEYKTFKRDITINNILQ